MTYPRSRFFATTLLVLAGFSSVTRAELPIIAKARAHLGSETALNSVKSLHFVGQLASADPADKNVVSIEIFFQAPYRQRVVSKEGKGVQITALDNYDAWLRVEIAGNPPRWNLTQSDKEQIKRLRASTWQNLAFYRGIEREGGKLLDQGDATIDGVACRKLAFIHAPNIIFYRYIEKATGRLVLSETESGATIREQGEIMAEGIRFPKTIINTVKLANGGSQVITITFSKITVNETFDDSLFANPIYSNKAK